MVIKRMKTMAIKMMKKVTIKSKDEGKQNN
jgi:hypothetical protein